jgi:hypothetical protein
MAYPISFLYTAPFLAGFFQFRTWSKSVASLEATSFI